MSKRKNWIEQRLPIFSWWKAHMTEYYVPKNLNIWYIFGVLSLLVLVNQLLTGIWLTMHYVPTVEGAFASIEYIMREVPYGWLLRYMHSTGASAFFIVIYLHMFRSLLYGSYKAPRELVWIFGMLLYLLLMAEAFMGYVLPWGQMSFWGAQVIINLLGAIPFVGEDLAIWVRGDYLVSGATLSRFFALHVIAIPLALLGLVFLHIVALHQVGSNNPDGVDIKQNKNEKGIPRDGVPFHPFYTVRDLVGVVVFLFVFCSIIFFAPEMGGYFLEYANFEPADNLKTPEHIAPVWYFTPFYAMLRAITFDLGPFDSKLLGVMTMGAAIAVLFILPWLDRSPVRSLRYKGNISRIALILLAAVFVILGNLGIKEPTPARTALAQICTFLYFTYFVAMPFWTVREKCRSVPDRVQKKGLSKRLVAGAVLLFAALVILPLSAVAAGGGCGEVPCEKFVGDRSDKTSLRNGASLFGQYCIACHSLQYMRFQQVANDLDIDTSAMKAQFLFADQPEQEKKLSDHMMATLSPDAAQKGFGVTPPDLSLITRAHKPDWLLTFLLSFYQDNTRLTGVNNKVLADVAMPHVLAGLQGLQECSSSGNSASDTVLNTCNVLEVKGITGAMTPDEYRQSMNDLVNFLKYIGDPVVEKRHAMGVKVLIYLCLFFVCALLLSREYWRGIQ